MIKGTFSVLAVVTIAIFLGAIAKADEGKYKAYYGWHAVGNMEEMKGGAKKFTGTLHGSSFDEGGFGHLFSVVCPIVNNIDAKGVMDASGTCKMTDLGGNTIDLKWSCKGAPKCQGTFTFTGGTGKYKAISGDNNFYAAFITNTEGYSWWDGQYKY
jgi:hypothetical protein